MTTDRLAFWDAQATKGETAGTQDLGLVRLERRVISAHTQPHFSVLDVGCGTGETLGSLRVLQGVGIDFSPAMVEAARANGIDARVGRLPDDLSALVTTTHHVAYAGASVRHGPSFRYDCQQFDLVYTQRCLINLPTWDDQRRAIERLSTLLYPGGVLLLVEHCQEGLNMLNDQRRAWHLPVIEPPWHNRYLRVAEVETLDLDLVCEASAVDFSWAYYYASRIWNAAEAARVGHGPQYNAVINQLAAAVEADPPHGCGWCGQARYWRWRRHT